MKPTCELAGKCSGCPHLLTLYSQQLEEKKTRFLEAWQSHGFAPLKNFSIKKVAEERFRNRADLVLNTQGDKTVLGMYDRERKHLLDLENCPALTEPLERWLQEFRTDLPSLRVGSVRLRVAPKGQRGVWLDLANQDTKALLDDRKWLERLSKKAIVEIGQKRKRLIEKEGRLGLGEPVLFPWTETYSGEKAIPLYSVIGGFTQISPLANKILSETVHELMPQTEDYWLELGAGSGTFTLPLLALGKKVMALETDSLSLQGLIQSANESKLSMLLDAHEIPFDRPSEILKEGLKTCGGILADPPRSGLGGALDFLESVGIESKPKHFLYVSCWQESFLKDTKKLLSLGYKPMQVVGVDQFAHSEHLELVALFTRH